MVWASRVYTLIGGLGAVILGYFLIGAVTWALQEKLLYHPDPHFPDAAMVSAKGLRMWPGQARGEYRGFISAQGRPKAKGTVVVFHGNAGLALDRRYYIEALEPRGLRVVLAEYPVFGGRPGELGEGPFVSDGRGTVKRALEQWGEPVVRAALAASRAIGLQPVITRTCGGSDGNELNANGIPTVVLGIGGNDFHSRRERMAISELVKLAQLIAALSVVEKG